MKKYKSFKHGLITLNNNFRTSGTPLNKSIGRLEKICDKCGKKTSALRRHFEQWICLSCKIDALQKD